MKIGVCGIACEKCPKMKNKSCPNKEEGCKPKNNPFCKISKCAYEKHASLCFECHDFPCETTKSGPISYGYCQYLSGKK